MFVCVHIKPVNRLIKGQIIMNRAEPLARLTNHAAYLLMPTCAPSPAPACKAQVII